MTTLDLWSQARLNVGRCERCEDWERRGLSSTCPRCDAAAIEEHKRLKELQDNPSGMGVLFEAGSAKFIKSMSSEEVRSPQFVSSWQQASQFEHSKWKSDPDGLLATMKLERYKDTIKFIALALFYPNPMES